MKLSVVLLALGALTVVSSMKLIPLRSALPVDLDPQLKQSGNVKDIWSTCGNKTYIVTPLKVTISPDPPQKGTNLEVQVALKSSETIKSGSIHAVVKLDGVQLYSSTFDLCETLITLNSGVTCPLEQGKTITGAVTHEIPGFLPPGTYSVTATVTDQNNKEVFCLQVDTHL